MLSRQFSDENWIISNCKLIYKQYLRMGFEIIDLLYEYCKTDIDIN